MKNIIILFLVFLKECMMPLSEKKFDGHKLYGKESIEIVDAIDDEDGFKLDELIKKRDINTVGKRNISFVAYAMLNNRKKSFKLLVDKGADVNIPIETESQKLTYLINVSSQLNDSFYFNNLIGVSKLNSVDEKGYPVIHDCVYAGYYDRVNILLDKGADINAVDKMHYTVLYLICSLSNFKEAYGLLLRGADPSIPSNIGDTVYDLVYDKKVVPDTEKSYYREKILITIAKSKK